MPDQVATCGAPHNSTLDSMNDTLRALDESGYAIAPAVMGPTQLASIEEALASVPLAGAGTRNLLEFPWCRTLVDLLRQCTQVAAALPRKPVAVQCTLFDKSLEKNWLVALHQDLSIPVRERVPHPECTGWSEKEGVLYVQPPVAVLELLVAVRAHLDDCGSASGPLRVVPGSAACLRRPPGRCASRAATSSASLAGVTSYYCARSCFIHRPRLRAPRRVLHFLFGPQELTCGLKWHRAV